MQNLRPRAEVMTEMEADAEEEERMVEAFSSSAESAEAGDLRNAGYDDREIPF